jgi:hypothetical protein
MDLNFKALNQPSVLTIFTYVPAGLGHLRVTDALHKSQPSKSNSLIFGSHDTTITWLHRITSSNLLLRRFMEWVQRDTPQYIFTHFYRRWLRVRTKNIYQQFSILLDQYLDKPKKVLVIATHFGLAHQLAVIKDKIEEEYDIKLFLVVQVTDATPQFIWLVPGADLTFVPDYKTMQELNAYRRQQGFKPMKIEVQPYPLNPLLIKNLTRDEFISKKNQLDPKIKFKINLAVPISGAAVGLNYFSELVNHLITLPANYQVCLVAKFSRYTKDFIFKFINKDPVQIYSGRNDQQVVIDYLRLYQSEVVCLEITKPSEQAFKVLLDPVQRGGAIMLFCEPIGRQEYDNLEFLQSHHLIPDQQEQAELWQLFELNKRATTNIKKRAKYWRGVQLPKNPIKSANFIQWLYRQGIFLQMLKFQPGFNLDRREVSDQGVNIFWKRVNRLLE